jgi:hypothetical protein
VDASSRSRCDHLAALGLGDYPAHENPHRLAQCAGSVARVGAFRPAIKRGFESPSKRSYVPFPGGAVDRREPRLSSRPMRTGYLPLPGHQAGGSDSAYAHILLATPRLGLPGTVALSDRGVRRIGVAPLFGQIASVSSSNAATSPRR